MRSDVEEYLGKAKAAEVVAKNDYRDEVLLKLGIVDYEYPAPEDIYTDNLATQAQYPDLHPETKARCKRVPAKITDEEWEAAKKIIIDGYTSEKEVEPGVESVCAQLLRTVTSNYNISRAQFWRELKEFDWFPYRPLFRLLPS